MYSVLSNCNILIRWKLMMQIKIRVSEENEVPISIYGSPRRLLISSKTFTKIGKIKIRPDSDAI